jgi:hypothetical protein
MCACVRVCVCVCVCVCVDTSYAYTSCTHINKQLCTCKQQNLGLRIKTRTAAEIGLYKGVDWSRWISAGIRPCAGLVETTLVLRGADILGFLLMRPAKVERKI